MEHVVGKVDDMKDGEMKEVKLGDKKALLCRVKGNYYATSHLCTHYKAQLVKGTLTNDGRLMCPWHGACFKVQTGDIEDAPALDDLLKFQVRIDGEKVIVIANEEELKAGRSLPKMVKRNPDDKRVFIVVGGGPAGLNAAEVLRGEGYTGRLILISKEGNVPIDRVKLSKSVKIEPAKIELRPLKFFKDHDIELFLNKEVSAVDPTQQTVSLNDGQVLKYDSLLLAPGGSPRNFWPSTKKMQNVFVVRGISDAQNLEKYIEEKPKSKILVIGSSFIGMEAAAILVPKCSSLTVVGMEAVPFERVLGNKIGLALQKLHESKGVKFTMGVVIKDFEVDDKGNAKAAVLASGQKIECDIVVLGVGVEPDTGFLKKSFPLEKDGSILVDQSLAVQGFKNVYAAGDAAKYPYHLPHGAESPYIRVEHWNVASQHGRAAALSMLGKTSPFKLVPYFWTAQYGRNLRYCGHALHFNEIFIEGNLDELTFVAYFSDGDKVLGTASLGRDPAISHISELLRIGLMPSLSKIKSGLDPMSIPLYSQPASSLTEIQ